MIFVGPYDLPIELAGFDNIIYIKDFGTPIRCQQMGLLASSGKWITWAADDGFFLDGALDVGFDLISNDEDVVMGKYYEGESNEIAMSDSQYYLLNYHPPTRSSFIPAEFYTLNVGLVPSMLLKDVGGWDCQFEVCPMSYADLAFRLQNQGIIFTIQDEVMFRCSHMPGTSGDHGPIHYAQILHDEPLYQSIYGTPDCKDRNKIDINNHLRVPSVWARRFSQ